MLKQTTQKLSNASYQGPGRAARCVLLGAVCTPESAEDHVQYEDILGYTKVLGQSGLWSEGTTELKREKGYKQKTITTFEETGQFVLVHRRHMI